MATHSRSGKRQAENRPALAAGGPTRPRGVTGLATKAGLQTAGVASQWDLLLRLAIEETRASGQFLLPGIGKVVLDRRNARKGRNPQTGQSMVIPPKTTLRFRFLKTFKEAVLPEVPAAGDAVQKAPRRGPRAARRRTG